MRFSLAVAVMVMAVGCGDNLTTTDAPAMTTPGATSAVGGSQVSHSKSFMLVTSVATGHSQIAKSQNFISKAGVGGSK